MRTQQEIENRITSVTLAATNDGWIYNAHSETRKAMAMLLVDHLHTGQREAKIRLTRDEKRISLRDILEHYSEEILNMALDISTED